MKNKLRGPQLGLLALSWPMFIEEITGGVTSFTDTLFLSMISDTAAGAIGMLGSVLMLGYFIMPQFTSAGTSVASQYMGAKRDDHVVPTWLANILISVSAGALFSLVVFICAPNVGLWLGMDSIQNGYAADYLSIIAINFVLVGLRTSYGSILASKTLTQWNMVSSVTTNLINIPLNYILMTGWWIFPEMGIKGIALATVLSYFIGFLIQFCLIHFGLHVKFFIKGVLSLAKKEILPIVKIGVPSALEPFSYTIQSIIVSAIIIKLGAMAMTANTYVNKFNFLDMAASWSLTMGGQIIISHYLGAKKIDAVKKTYWKIAAMVTSFAFVVYLAVVLFPNFFLSFFTHDKAIIEMAKPLLIIALFMEPIRAINVLGGVALKTVGDGKFSVIMSMLFMWGLVPILFFCVMQGFGILGVWICLLADETIRSLLNIWRWKSGRWLGKTVIES